MLMRVDCNLMTGMEAVISDPDGKVLCPIHDGAWGSAQVKNRCDCMGMAFEPDEGAPGNSFLDAATWHPKKGLYHIRVKGRAPCKIVIGAGAMCSRTPHWTFTDSLNIESGEELVWTAKWGSIGRDSTRVILQRLPTNSP
jgi:hypothetical protein